MSESKISVEMLMAGNGDCIIISFSDNAKNVRNILIDGGNDKQIFSDHLQKRAEKIIEAGQKIDLCIITHIDQDHIKGVVYLTREMISAKGKIKSDLVGKYWFNSALNEKLFKENPKSFDISADEMRELERYLHNQPDEHWDIKDLVFYPSTRHFFGSVLTILSPNQQVLGVFSNEYKDYDIGALSDDYSRSLKELYDIEKKRFEDGKEELDDKLENATSIAFLFEFREVSLLHLGDAIPAVVDIAIENLIAERGIEKLTVSAVKLSHHASRKSISSKFLKLINTTKYLVSTNGKKARLPNKATFAKILLNENRDLLDHIEFYFNYPDFSSILRFTEEELCELNFSCHDANFEHGHCLSLEI